jgi:hypothetical protein
LVTIILREELGGLLDLDHQQVHAPATDEDVEAGALTGLTAASADHHGICADAQAERGLERELIRR